MPQWRVFNIRRTEGFNVRGRELIWRHNQQEAFSELLAMGWGLGFRVQGLGVSSSTAGTPALKSPKDEEAWMHAA